MRKYIRNMLLETLILESPLFRAVAFKDGDRVYEGQPYHTHAHLFMDQFGEYFKEYDDIWKLIDSLGLIDGFITINGEFVSRDEAAEMVKFPESHAMWANGEMK